MIILRFKIRRDIYFVCNLHCFYLSIFSYQVAAEVDISSHSLHSAQDRQEAALGLAELSLFGAGAAGGNANSADPASVQQQANQKTKTFFKEEEEDMNDPNVTKIILSKEGGVMNSQDPHQCPICHRCVALSPHCSILAFISLLELIPPIA